MRSIYSALGKSVEKANKKSTNDRVKKVKVHISVSKDTPTRESRGTAIVPRREVVIGAEHITAESIEKLERFKIKESGSSDEALTNMKRKSRKNTCSTVQLLNYDLSSGRSYSDKLEQCKCFSREGHVRSHKKGVKNCNVLEEKSTLPARMKTEPGSCWVTSGHDLHQLNEKKHKSSRSHRRPCRQLPTSDIHMPAYSSLWGRVSPVVDDHDDQTRVHHFSGYHLPVTVNFRKDVPSDPSYAYHADENKYLYMHAAPRQPPCDEQRHSRRHKSKHRRARENGDKGLGISMHHGTTSVVHKHEHVHHHYHHYGEKR